MPELQKTEVYEQLECSSSIHFKSRVKLLLLAHQQKENKGVWWTADVLTSMGRAQTQTKTVLHK